MNSNYPFLKLTALLNGVRGILSYSLNHLIFKNDNSFFDRSRTFILIGSLFGGSAAIDYKKYLNYFFPVINWYFILIIVERQI